MLCHLQRTSYVNQKEGLNIKRSPVRRRRAGVAPFGESDRLPRRTEHDPPSGLPSCWRASQRDTSRNTHRLGVDELHDAERAEFAPVAAILDAAER